jgi:hypothetical protein
MSHQAYEIGKCKRVWMAVREGTGLAIHERTDQSSSANDDVMVTDVKSWGQKMTRIINVYDQRDVQTGVRRGRKLS